MTILAPKNVWQHGNICCTARTCPVLASRTCLECTALGGPCELFGFVLAPALALPKSDMCSPWRKDRELTKPFTILSGSTFSIFLTGDILVFLLLVCFCDIGRTVSIFLVKGYFSADCKASFPLSFFCCSMHETSKVRNCYEGESSDMRVNTTFLSFLLSELLPVLACWRMFLNVLMPSPSVWSSLMVICYGTPVWWRLLSVSSCGGHQGHVGWKAVSAWHPHLAFCEAAEHVY